jgi:methylated-DNA-[protein]-cysteine S-methyltransferase
MTREQLDSAIALGEQLSNGEADLVALDEKSLAFRGKKSKRKLEPAAARRKRKSDLDDENTPRQKKQATRRKVSSYFQAASGAESEKVKNKVDESEATNRPSSEIINLIKSSSDLTPFRRSILALLTQVPRGRYTTYQALADHVGGTSHKSSARAVGSAMQNNPFAPAVPCHRVLASDGTIGGFGGQWGEGGQHASEKRSLLREEGVKFDGKGKAVGSPFRGFR